MNPLPPRVVLCTLNARYIHASLGLRYLLANLDRHGGAGLRAQARLCEYTLARPLPEVLADLLQVLGPVCPGRTQIIGLGVYIWNVAASTALVRALRQARADLRVVLGGPEVSHEWQTQPITALADHVITGWGDVSFARLCRQLLDAAPTDPAPDKLLVGVQPPLHEIELPYDEFTDADLAHRQLYLEASRGCPFRCAFCLSALDASAWAFAPERVLAALHALVQRGARSFKFVDRTFNLKMEHALAILQFFLAQPGAAAGVVQAASAPGWSLHFELVPDRLPERLRAVLSQFAPGVVQLEVGVQTFNPAVQRRIDRRQDNAATESNLRWLRTQTQAHLHVDLIFGLPGETLESFAAGFDRLLALNPHEIQLGLLKRLRGTPLTRLGPEHAMVYDAQPPYTVQSTAVLDDASVQRFVRMARFWDLLANSGRFARTLALLLGTVPSPLTDATRLTRVAGLDAGAGLDRAGDLDPARLNSGSAFWRFMALSDQLWRQLGRGHDLSPEQLLDALADVLGPVWGWTPVRQTLLADYLASGARASPRSLHGLLPRQRPPQPPSTRTLVRRQQQHRASGSSDVSQ